MPEPTTESIVAAAVASADFPDATPAVETDAPETDATVEEPAAAAAVVEGAPAVKEGETVVPPVAEEDDDPELTKLLEEYGIKKPAKDVKDNRMPYSRVRKITGKLVKGIHEKHTAALAERDGKFTAVEARIKNYEAADGLAKTDPKRYVGILAAMYPEQWGPYATMTPAAVKAEVKEVKAAAQEPIPGPDWKFDDGSVGYSPAQQEKREKWLMNQAKADALAEMEERYGKRLAPLEQRIKDEAANAEQLPRIQQQLARATATWGELFTAEYKKDKDSDILKAMAADPTLTFDAACAQVLLPRQKAALQAEREKMRTEVLAELAKRPAAATGAPLAQERAPVDPKKDMTTEDIVRAAMAAAGLK